MVYNNVKSLFPKEENMKCIIKNKMVSLSGSSTVKDEEGNDIFFVEGKVLSATRVKTISGPDHTALFKIRNKAISMFSPKVFILDTEDKILMTLKKKGFFGAKFDLIPSDESKDKYAIKGNFLARKFDILKNGESVANVKKNFNVLTDSYTLETPDDENAAFFVTIVIALDNFFDKARR